MGNPSMQTSMGEGGACSQPGPIILCGVDVPKGSDMGAAATQRFGGRGLGQEAGGHRGDKDLGVDGGELLDLLPVFVQDEPRERADPQRLRLVLSPGGDVVHVHQQPLRLAGELLHGRRDVFTGAAPRGSEVDHDPTAAHVRIVHVPRDGLGGRGGGHVRVVRGTQSLGIGAARDGALPGPESRL